MGNDSFTDAMRDMLQDRMAEIMGAIQVATLEEMLTTDKDYSLVLKNLMGAYLSAVQAYATLTRL